jgi:hypothetical protein
MVTDSQQHARNNDAFAALPPVIAPLACFEQGPWLFERRCRWGPGDDANALNFIQECIREHMATKLRLNLPRSIILSVAVTNTCPPFRSRANMNSVAADE